MREDSPSFTHTIPAWLAATHIHGMQRGIEKESLRMQANGFLAQTKHPAKLGSALTHPYITTDYSEALLELITPPFASPQQALDFLRQLHVVVQHNLPEGETLWPLSMPCMLDKEEENIPLADYGTSNLGQFKTLYRRGLGIRYGRRMQTIAGLHYNVSFPDSLFEAWQQDATTSVELKALSVQDYRSNRYFGLIRNFLRLSPLVVYLMGASPSVCACFLTGRQHTLKPLVGGTLYLPDATALRMGRLGYQNSAQRQLGIHYNQVDEYLQGIEQAIYTPYAPFTALGLDDKQGKPLQINDHVLQIENEYYSPIRPKQVPQVDETPAQALKKRGVAYIELRAVDLNPYSDIGIDLDTAGFLEVLALYCLTQDSPVIASEEQDQIDQNLAKIVDEGRKADLLINTQHGQQDFKQWAAQHMQRMQDIAQFMDASVQQPIYQTALAHMNQRLQQVEATLSAQVLKDTVSHGGSWRFGHSLASRYAETQKQAVLEPKLQADFEQLAQQSLYKQQQLEQQEKTNFKDFLHSYRVSQASQNVTQKERA